MAIHARIKRTVSAVFPQVKSSIWPDLRLAKSNAQLFDLLLTLRPRIQYIFYFVSVKKHKFRLNLFSDVKMKLKMNIALLILVFGSYLIFQNVDPAPTTKKPSKEVELPYCEPSTSRQDQENYFSASEDSDEEDEL